MAREPRKRLRSGVLVLALFVAFFWPATAGAADESPAEFLEASAKAYAPYRSAMSYLKTGNPGLAALALDATAARWATLCDRFRDRPPGAFAADPDWQASLDGITGRIADARAKLEAGNTKGARTALAPVRADLGDLRRRNGIETFSDRIDAFSAAMDAIWVHRRNPPDMTDPEALAALAEQARALHRALEHVAAEPPEKTAADLQFQRLVAGALGSIATIDRAIEAGNSALLISALREIRSSEQLLWMNFG
jgi:hypothetical protein